MKLCISHKVCEVKFHKGHDGSWFLVINLWGHQGWHMVQYDMKAWVPWLHFFGVKLIKPGSWVLFHWTPIMGSRNCPFNSLWEGSPESIHNSTIVELQTALNSLTALGRRGRGCFTNCCSENRRSRNSCWGTDVSTFTYSLDRSGWLLFSTYLLSKSEKKANKYI